MPTDRQFRNRGKHKKQSVEETEIGGKILIGKIRSIKPKRPSIGLMCLDSQPDDSSSSISDNSLNKSLMEEVIGPIKQDELYEKKEIIEMKYPHNLEDMQELEKQAISPAIISNEFLASGKTMRDMQCGICYGLIFYYEAIAD